MGLVGDKLRSLNLDDNLLMTATDSLLTLPSLGSFLRKLYTASRSEAFALYFQVSTWRQAEMRKGCSEFTHFLHLAGHDIS